MIKHCFVYRKPAFVCLAAGDILKTRTVCWIGALISDSITKKILFFVRMVLIPSIITSCLLEMKRLIFVLNKISLINLFPNRFLSLNKLRLFFSKRIKSATQQQLIITNSTLLNSNLIDHYNASFVFSFSLCNNFSLISHIIKLSYIDIV